MTWPTQEEGKRALAEQVVRGVAARREAGTQAPRRRLPKDKFEYPKLLCLDQNKWIDLARAHYGREDGTPFRDALDAVRQGIANGKLVVPITGANLYEAAEHPDERRRERLARFMVDLSQNHSLMNHQIVMLWELHRAILALFKEQRTLPAIRPALLHPGMFVAATGKYPVVETGETAIDALVTDALYDPEIAVTSIVQFMDREAVRELRDEDKDAAKIVEGIRQVDAHLALDDRRKLEMRNLLAEGSTATKLGEVLGDMGVNPADFQAWLREGANLSVFTDAVPAIDVHATLMLRRDLNTGHRSHPNDAKDFSFLQLALPYANIVVAEKSWTHFALTSGLGERYGTVIVRDARALRDVLRSEGCLP